MEPRDESYPGISRALRLGAYALLAFAALDLLAVLLFGSGERRWIFPFGMLLVSLYLARFLYRRSQNLEAVFGTTRVRPTSSDDLKLQAESGGLIVAVLLVAFDLYHWWK